MSYEPDNTFYVTDVAQIQARETVYRLTGKYLVPSPEVDKLSVQQLLDIYRDMYRDIPALASANKIANRAGLITVTCKPGHELTVEQFKMIYNDIVRSKKIAVIESRYTIELTKAGVNHLHVAVIYKGDLKASYIQKLKSCASAGYVDVKKQKKGEDPRYAYACMTEYFDKEGKDTVIKN